MKKAAFILSLLIIALIANATVITEWTFETTTPPPTLTPTTGSGTVSPIGGVTHDTFNGGNGSTYAWSTTNYPVQGTNNRTAGILIEVSTTGYSGISFSWHLRHSSTSANREVLYYTLDKTAPAPVWVEAADHTVPAGDAYYVWSFDGSSISGLNNNANLAFKIVSAFSNTEDTQYVGSTNPYAGGKWRFDNISIQGTASTPILEITEDLTPFYTMVNTESAIQTYALTGLNLTSDVTVTAPAGFLIRLSGVGSFLAQLILTPTGGILNKNIDIEFYPAIAGIYSDNIVHSGGGVSNLNLAVYGSTSKPEPTNYPGGFSVGGVTYYQAMLQWTDSAKSILPDGYLIIGSDVSAADIIPPMDTIEQGDDYLVYVVPFGAEAKLATGLVEATTYYFQIFPYTNTGIAIDYKTDGIIPTVSFTTTTGPIGSTLASGALAFIEYCTDSPDEIVFVLLTNVGENTKIYFTDDGWDGTAFMGTENIYLWQAVGRAYAAGEVIHLKEGVYYPDEGNHFPDFGGFSNSGDQILAYQGTESSPAFLAGFSSYNWITSGVPTNSTSYLPSSLTLGTNAIGFPTEIDDGYYNGTMIGTAAELLALINNPANWTRASSIGNLTFPNWQFSIDGILPVVLNSFTATCTSDLFAQLNWTVQSETNHLGYNVLRSSNDQLGDAELVNPALISDGSHNGTEVTYNYIDLETEINHTYYYWLESLDLDGVSVTFGPVSITLTDPENPDTPPVVPLKTDLGNPYPNPFKLTVNLKYTLAKSEKVSIDLFNLKGEKICNLVDTAKDAGTYTIDWDGRNENMQACAAGIYFARMTAGKYVITKKILLAK
jgi:hypothetical protein